MKLSEMLLDAAGILAGEPVVLVTFKGDSIATRTASAHRVHSPRGASVEVHADGAVRHCGSIWQAIRKDDLDRWDDAQRRAKAIGDHAVEHDTLGLHEALMGLGDDPIPQLVWSDLAAFERGEDVVVVTWWHGNERPKHHAEPAKSAEVVGDTLRVDINEHKRIDFTLTRSGEILRYCTPGTTYGTSAGIVTRESLEAVASWKKLDGRLDSIFRLGGCGPHYGPRKTAAILAIIAAGGAA